MTNALLIILLGVAQGVASDLAIMRGHPLIGLAYTLSSFLALVVGVVLLISAATQ